MEKWQEEIEAILKQKFNELKQWQEAVTKMDKTAPDVEMSAEFVAEQLKHVSKEWEAPPATFYGFFLGVGWERNKRKRRKKADI